MLFTSTTKSIKRSDVASKRTLYNRKKFVYQQLQPSAGDSSKSVTLQTGRLLKSFGADQRKENNDV